jgi:hypothetical protein
VPFDHSNEECLLRMQRERDVYDRLAQCGGHDGLLLYYGVCESGIRLEYAAGQNLRLHLGDSSLASAAQRYAGLSRSQRPSSLSIVLA